MLLNILDRQCSLICGTGTKFYEHRREWIGIRYWKQSLYSKSLNNVQVMKIKLECATISLHRQQNLLGAVFHMTFEIYQTVKMKKRNSDWDGTSNCTPTQTWRQNQALQQLNRPHPWFFHHRWVEMKLVDLLPTIWLRVEHIRLLINLELVRLATKQNITHK